MAFLKKALVHPIVHLRSGIIEDQVVPRKDKKL
jgi:hypothetical protein